MGQHTKNDELREDRSDQEKRRQEIRDDASEESNGGSDDIGSQDKRRKEGRNAPDLKELREDEH